MKFLSSPKLRRNVARILPFGFIWLFCSWVFLANDLATTRNQNLNPDTDATLTLEVFIFANIAIFILGLIVGSLEMIVFEKRFSKVSLPTKIVSKLLIYSGILFVVIIINFPIAASIEENLSPLHPEIIDKLFRFLGSATFVTTSIQLAAQLLLTVIYASISENLGHVAYFNFLQKYYEIMSDPIIQNHGEVYQYIGDEVVITWDAQIGLKNEHCISCFFDLKQQVKDKAEAFLKEFEVSPDFKAGIHIGEVSTGEIGALKKEIVYTGDVLNTTARIQGMCKELDVDLIISEDLKEDLPTKPAHSFKYLNEIQLRGKATSTKLFTLS
jgi:adenylate cyclase